MEIFAKTSPQVIVGVFLEMEQEGWLGSLKVLIVYLAGVLAGSLGTSLSDPDTYIAGASGGVYALIAAHLATMTLNWAEDSHELWTASSHPSVRR